MISDVAQYEQAPSPRPILLVEDDPKDVEIAKAAFELCEVQNKIVVARDGVEALDYLNDPANTEPAAVVLDLKLPRLGGLDLLWSIRSDPALSRLPVVVFTASRERQDIVESEQAGISAYVVKPVEFIGYLNAISDLSQLWRGSPQRPI